VNNFSFSTYHALHVSGTKRLSRRYGLALTGAYTWSHMIDNSSEIFGPGVRIIANPFAIGAGSATAVEAITPFPQSSDNHLQGERGHSSFDRRHRLAFSYLWALPSPSAGAARAVLGNWQFSGFFTIQSGQPFTPINAFGRCVDALGDGVLTNDRPDIGNPSAPANSVALLNNTLCLDPSNPLALANPVAPGQGAFITATGVGISPSNARFVQVPRNRLGTAGRNILIGPRLVNLDFAVFKNFPFAERRNLQFRMEVYNLFNTRNPGNAIGNVFSTDAQPVPGIAFAPVAPTVTPARVIGVIPENMIDAVDAVSGDPLFLSRRFMNTSARKFQFAVKFLF